MRTTPRSKSVREAEEIHLEDGAEHFRHSTLENFVLQGHDPQWPSPAIRFRNVCSPRGLCPVRSAMHTAVQTLKISLKVCLVVLPSHSVYSRCSVPVDRQERVAQPFDGDVVKERAESLVLVPFCCYAHTIQRIRHAQSPALCPGRVLLARVLLGQPPSLRHLRGDSFRFVRQLRRYYGAVRLPRPVHRWIAVVDLPSAACGSIYRRRTVDLPVLAHRVSTHVRGLRPRRVVHDLALARMDVWPSAQNNGVGTLVRPVFAAQYSTCVCPCQRFPDILSDTET